MRNHRRASSDRRHVRRAVGDPAAGPAEPGRVVALAVAVLAVVVGFGGPAPAHGGSGRAVTSNYRVELDGVQPATDGLRVDVVDIDGTLRLTWTGAGTVVVDGYDGEPYLRIDATGVARNVHSPATYLNQNRYARVELPATADSSAAPAWQQLSGGRTVEWHDHRTHWMDVTPPPAVQADPSIVHVIIDGWQVPLTVDGAPVDDRRATAVGAAGERRAVVGARRRRLRRGARAAGHAVVAAGRRRRRRAGDGAVRRRRARLPRAQPPWRAAVGLGDRLAAARRGDDGRASPCSCATGATGCR